MIVRVWRGETSRQDAAAYAAYIKRTGIAGYRRTPGHLRAVLLSRTVGIDVEFLLISTWSSIEAVERYAGEVPEWAVFYPEDRRYLVTYDAIVGHYEEIASEGDLLGLTSRRATGGSGAHLDSSA